eukprot:1262835-Prymnesium_polylepis.1
MCRGSVACAHRRPPTRTAAHVGRLCACRHGYARARVCTCPSMHMPPRPLLAACTALACAASTCARARTGLCITDGAKLPVPKEARQTMGTPG